MMLIPEHKQYQDAPDGLYPQYHNSRIQDIAVGPSGVHHLVTPSLPTGVVQSSMVMPLGSWALMLVMRSSTLSRVRAVFVPSGVWLINTEFLNIMVENLQIYKDASELIDELYETI